MFRSLGQLTRTGLIPAAVLAVAACDAPTTGGMFIPDDAVEAFADASVEDIVGQPNTATLFATFEQLCVANLGALSRVPGQLRANGYTLLVSDGEVAMYANPEASRPMVGLAGDRQSDPEFCMVLAPDTATNRSAFARYLASKPGNAPFNIQVPGADSVFVNSTRGEIYITVRQNDARLGSILGVGVGGL